MFHLERPDVLSGGDLGIRKAIQIEYGLEEMPTPSGCSRSVSPGARTAASPRSISGSRWPRSPTERRPRKASPAQHRAGLADNADATSLLARPRRGPAGRGRSGDGGADRPRRRQRRLPAQPARRGGARRPPGAGGREAPVGQLASAAAFFQADGDFTQHEFDVIAQLAAAAEALSAAAFIAARAARRRRGLRTRTRLPIVEPSPDGSSQGRPRPIYYPLAYTASKHGFRPPLGFDLGSDPNGSLPGRARDNGRPTATRSIPAAARRPRHQRLPAVYRDGAPTVPCRSAAPR